MGIGRRKRDSEFRDHRELLSFARFGDMWVHLGGISVGILADLGGFRLIHVQVDSLYLYLTRKIYFISFLAATTDVAMGACIDQCRQASTFKLCMCRYFSYRTRLKRQSGLNLRSRSRALRHSKTKIWHMSKFENNKTGDSNSS